MHMYLTIAIATYMHVIVATYMHVSNLRISRANLSIDLLKSRDAINYSYAIVS